jgi:DNA-binding MarR family transcriptional regulator
VTTRWLTATEQHCWRSFLNACQALFGAIDAQLLRDSDLPHGYYEILVHLSEAPGRSLRMTQLAEASTFSKSRLSHAVTRLEERGLVVRHACPTDRRGQIAELTDEGFAVLAAAAPGHVAQVHRSLIGALSPEQIGQLTEISTAIIAASRTARPASAGRPDAAGCQALSGCADELAGSADEPSECAGELAGSADELPGCGELRNALHTGSAAS